MGRQKDCGQRLEGTSPCISPGELVWDLLINSVPVATLQNRTRRNEKVGNHSCCRWTPAQHGRAALRHGAVRGAIHVIAQRQGTASLP